jgi:hypothetical protein
MKHARVKRGWSAAGPTGKERGSGALRKGPILRQTGNPLSGQRQPDIDAKLCVMKATSAVIVLLVATLADGQTTAPKRAATTSATAPKPAGLQNNPFYSAWANFKVGTESDYQLSVTKDGIVTKLPLHYVLVDSNADKAILELNFPAGTRVTLPAKLDASGGGKVDGWPGILYQLPYIPLVGSFSGHEKIEIEGKTFDCRYGSNDLGEMKVKQWFSADVAGGLVKSQVVADQHTTMELMLLHVRAPQ